MRDKQQVKDFIKFFKKPVSAFTMNTSDQVIKDLIEEGFIKSAGLKYDAIQKTVVEKFVKTDSLETGYEND
jgi:hypothetical protein